MSDRHRTLDEVELMLDNARLRDELEPYVDDSLDRVPRMSLVLENEYLASMLAWERAPAIPIAKWVDPPLEMPHPDTLDDAGLHARLHQTIRQLYAAKVILEYTDHLTDRQLYTILYRDILPCCEKKLDLPHNYLHWRCVADEDEQTWLRFYASPVERRQWQELTGWNPPPSEPPPHPRRLPGSG